MIFRCTNEEDISRIINNPRIYRMITDDLSPDVYVPIIDDNVFYLMNEEKTGVIKLDFFNNITCQVHTTVMPALWGKADLFVKEVMAWGFTNTGYQKAITLIPEFNRLAIRLAKQCGLREEGRIKESFLKNWRRYDQLLLGITKEEFLLKQSGELSWVQ